MVFLVAALLARPAAAGTIEGVTLPDSMTVKGRSLTLNGLGVREATVLMVNVYAAGLYLEEKSSDPDVILRNDHAKALVMRFMRSVGRENLAETWTEGFDKNAGDLRTAVAEGLAKLNAAMVDVKKDDTIALIYSPDSGVTVAINTKEVAVIPGADFQHVPLFDLARRRSVEREDSRRALGGGFQALGRDSRIEGLEYAPGLEVPRIEPDRALGESSRQIEPAARSREPGNRHEGVGDRGIEARRTTVEAKRVVDAAVDGFEVAAGEDRVRRCDAEIGEL
jgi:hypothetical protein